jgi:DNA-directed RNA polymerase alpha subunit
MMSDTLLKVLANLDEINSLVNETRDLIVEFAARRDNGEEPEPDGEFIDRDVRTIEWGGQNGRVLRAFEYMGITTVAQLAKLTHHDLFICPNLGTKSIAYIKAVLAEHGLHLG